jgi:hypothetical protein
MEVERVGAPAEDPAEGSNVTLICSSTSESGEQNFYPKWFYYENDTYYPLSSTKKNGMLSIILISKPNYLLQP